MDTNKMREQFEVAYTAYCEKLGWKTYTAFHMLSEVYVKESTELAWQMWQASRDAVVVELPGLTDELLTAAYWDFDARRKGYPPYAAPAGQECGAFKVAIVSAVEAQGLKVAP